MFKHFKFLGETEMKSSVHLIDIPGFDLFDFRGMKLGFKLQEDVYQTGFTALIFPVRYDLFSLKNLNKRKKKRKISRSILTALYVQKMMVIIGVKFAYIAIGTGQMPASAYRLRVDSCCVADLMPSKLEEAFKRSAINR